MISFKEDTNVVNIAGQIIGELGFSHELFGEKFYNTFLKIKRLSESEDILPLTISERLIEDFKVDIGTEISVIGQLRSYNKIIKGKNRLILTIFAKEISVLDDSIKDPNNIFLDGYVCKSPVYRKTPLGREITDLLVAINRSYNKSDYIPCIAWGRNAKFSKSLKIGDRVQIWGRIQSREYEKKIGEENIEKKIAYEVSVAKMKKLLDSNIK